MWNDNLWKFVLLKSVGANEIGCKGNPTGLSLVGSPNWMPAQGESWTEPPLVMPWMSPVKLIVTLEISICAKVFDIYYWKGIMLIENVRILWFHWELILFELCLYYLHFFGGYVCFMKWWTMTFGEFESFMQLPWGLLWW